MKRRKTRSSLSLAAVLGMLIALLPVTAANADATDLLFTQYMEGSGYNKAVEIANLTAADISLDGYKLELYSNGSATPTTTSALTGTVPAGDVFVLVSNQAVDPLLGRSDAQASAVNWNGDDAIVLRNAADAPIDSIGQVGFDPGSEWGTNPLGTQDDTLCRLETVETGDVVVDDVFDPSSEWISLGNNNMAGLGFVGCEDPSIPVPDLTHSIYDIQFNGLAGTAVVTEGVATAVFYNGAFIQDGAGPWSGIFLYSPSVTPEVGDVVRVQGEVSEYYGLTQIGGGTTWILGTDTVPAPEVLPTADIPQEQWESVFVRAENAIVANEDLGNGEWSIDDGSGEVLVDDKGTYGYIPAAADTVGWLQGPLDFTYGSFKIQPRDDRDIYAGLAVCGEDFTAVYTIQGNGWSSPLDGVQVWTEGIVTADFQMSSQLSAFYIQDGTGDGDDATSDGVMVYHRDTWDYDVNVGDHVRLLATVDEYYGLTELTNVANLSVCGEGSIVPTAVELPLDDVDREAIEGMYVTFPQSLNIIEFFNFDRFGEYVLGNGRQFTPTNVFEPGSTDAEELAAANVVNQLRVDDARGGQNQDPAIHPNGDPFTLDNRFRGGDLVANLTGVVDYAFGDYKVQPTQGADYTAINPRTDAPEFATATVRVAAFNVLNLFTHLDDGSNDICGPLSNAECRGADTAEEYIRQRDKIVAGIVGLDADVVGLMEIENDVLDNEPVYPNQAHDPVIQLVAALNAAEAAAGDGYVWNWDVANYYNNYPVRNEVIYRNTVTPLGAPVALQDLAFDGVRPGGSGLGTEPVGRPPVAQSFADGNGEVFTVVANHFKSKGSSCASGVFDPITGDLLWLDPDSTNGQANCPLTRVKQAEAMMAWIATDPTGADDTDVLIIGDLNAYAMEDPIGVIEADGYTNLLKHFEGMYAYSYVFDGQLGNLDHALGSASIMSQVTGTAAWHINSDEPDILDYDMSFKQDAQDALYEPNAYRASDHDPVIVGLDLTAASDFDVEASPDSLWPPNHKYREVTVSGTDSDGDLWINILDVASSEMDCCYDDDDMPNDIVITGADTADLRAERYTEVDGRVYTLTVYAWDGDGQALLTTVYVHVPHDQRDKKMKN